MIGARREVVRVHSVTVGDVRMFFVNEEGGGCGARKNSTSKEAGDRDREVRVPR